MQDRRACPFTRGDGGDEEVAMESGAGIAVVFLQPECNMHCEFCVTDDAFASMPEPVAMALVAQLRARGVHTVTFGGGEPLTWRGDLWSLATHAQAHGMFVQVGTNGIALPADFAQRSCVDRWVLPLESVDPAVHDQLRRYRQQHHQIVRARLQALQQVGKSVTVSTVITTKNKAGLPALAAYLRDYHRPAANVHAWHLYRFLPLGRGGAANAAELQVPDEDYRAACAEVCALGLPFAVFRRPDMYRSRTVEFFWYEGGRVVTGAECAARPPTDRQPTPR